MLSPDVTYSHHQSISEEPWLATSLRDLSIRGIFRTYRTPKKLPLNDYATLSSCSCAKLQHHVRCGYRIPLPPYSALQLDDNGQGACRYVKHTKLFLFLYRSPTSMWASQRVGTTGVGHRGREGGGSVPMISHTVVLRRLASYPCKARRDHAGFSPGQLLNHQA